MVIGSCAGDIAAGDSWAVSGAVDTVSTGSSAGDTVATGSGAGDIVAAGSGAGDIVAAGSGAGDIGGSVAGEVIATGVGAGEAGADMFRFGTWWLKRKRVTLKFPLSHTTGVRSGV